MTTLDGAILRVMGDGKYRTIKDIYQSILERTTLYEGDIPKSTLWYHLLKLCREGKLKSFGDGGNRVLYKKV